MPGLNGPSSQPEEGISIPVTTGESSGSPISSTVPERDLDVKPPIETATTVQVPVQTEQAQDNTILGEALGQIDQAAASLGQEFKEEAQGVAQPAMSSSQLESTATANTEVKIAEPEPVAQGTATQTSDLVRASLEGSPEDLEAVVSNPDGQGQVTLPTAVQVQTPEPVLAPAPVTAPAPVAVEGSAQVEQAVTDPPAEPIFQQEDKIETPDPIAAGDQKSTLADTEAQLSQQPSPLAPAEPLPAQTPQAEEAIIPETMPDRAPVVAYPRPEYLKEEDAEIFDPLIALIDERRELVARLEKPITDMGSDWTRLNQVDEELKEAIEKYKENRGIKTPEVKQEEAA